MYFSECRVAEADYRWFVWYCRKHAPSDAVAICAVYGCPAAMRS